jgi:hypothetical protein
MKRDKKNNIQDNDDVLTVTPPTDNEVDDSVDATDGEKPSEATPADDARPSGSGQTDSNMSLKEVIEEQVTEEDAPWTRSLTLKKILGGDLLNTAAVRRQIWALLLIAFFAILYITNRYACQQDIIEIDKLQKELKDAKFKALSSNSKITEKSRESNVLELLKDNKDSVLKIASQPPYIINVPEDEQQ